MGIVGDWTHCESYTILTVQCKSCDRLISWVPLFLGQCHGRWCASIVPSSQAKQLTSGYYNRGVKLDSLGWSWWVLWAETPNRSLPFCTVNCSLLQWMAYCCVILHSEILGMMDFINWAFWRLYPWVISEVYMVHGEISNIVTLSTLADLNDLTETFNPQCLLSIDMSTKVCHHFKNWEFH